MSMLFAKIDPVAEIPEMESPFQYDVKQADYLTAVASPYKLGSTEVYFDLTYGTATFDEQGNMLTFKRLLNGSLTLGSDDLKDWGIDDKVILAKICNKVGTEAVDFVEGNPKNAGPL